MTSQSIFVTSQGLLTTSQGLLMTSFITAQGLLMTSQGVPRDTFYFPGITYKLQGRAYNGFGAASGPLKEHIGFGAAHFKLKRV